MNVLALVAHSDDEAVGCGGTLFRHAEKGDNVFLIVMADGVTSRAGSERHKRGVALEQSCDILGIELIKQFDYKDNQLDRYPLLNLVQAVEDVTRHLEFDIIYTHSRGDLNVDHRVVYDIAMTVFRPLPRQRVKAVYAFETLSATHWFGPRESFQPSCFVDIDRVWPRKKQAMESYQMEIMDFPHARSIETASSLATFRGSSVGVSKAEAFEVIRMVDKDDE